MEKEAFYAWKKGTNPKRARHYESADEMRRKKGNPSFERWDRIWWQEYDFAFSEEDYAADVQKYEKERQERLEQEPAYLYKKFSLEIRKKMKTEREKIKTLNAIQKLFVDNKESMVSDEFLEKVRSRTKYKCKIIEGTISDRKDLQIYIDPDDYFGYLDLPLNEGKRTYDFKYCFHYNIRRSQEKLQRYKSALKNFEETILKARSIAQQINELSENACYELQSFIRENVKGIAISHKSWIFRI